MNSLLWADRTSRRRVSACRSAVAISVITLALVSAILLQPTAALADSNPFPVGQCTWGAWQKWHDHYGSGPASTVRGNAKDWAWQARNGGMATGTTPAVNSIVVFQPSVRGADPTYGHVAYVTGVNSATSFNVVEMNNTYYGGWNIFSNRSNIIMTGGIEFIYATAPVSLTVYTKPQYLTTEEVAVSWNAIPNATRYGLTVWKSPWTGDSNAVFDQYVTGTSWSIGALPAGTYRIRMAAYYGTTLGPLSGTTQYFTVVTPPAPNPQVSLTAPNMPATGVSGQWFTPYGNLSPRHPAGATSVRLYGYHWESGRWVWRSNIPAKNADYYSFTKYSASFRLYGPGTWKWYAVALADDAHSTTWSPLKVVTLR